MIKGIRFIPIVTLFALVACTQDELPQESSGNGYPGVITFSTPYTATRSDALRSGSFQVGDQVGVLGYCKATYETEGGTVVDASTQEWARKKSFCKPDVFYNQLLTYQDDGSWTYDWSGSFENESYTEQLHPWASNPDETFSFFAYYPYAADGTIYPLDDDGNPIENNDLSMGSIELSGQNATGDPTIKYTMPHNTVVNLTSGKSWWRVPDFMLAYKVDHKRADGSVKLEFRHLFCAFEFQINNYNDFPIVLEDMSVNGGQVTGSGRNARIESGFYRSLTVTGQQSDYTVDEDDLYVGEFKLVGEDTEYVVPSVTCGANETGLRIEYNDEPITLLFIPNADGKLTTDNNESLSISLRITKDGSDFSEENGRTMNLKDVSFEPGMRSIFNINVIGDDIYVQVRSGGQWEDEGDSDIIFE